MDRKKVLKIRLSDEWAAYVHQIGSGSPSAGVLMALTEYRATHPVKAGAKLEVVTTEARKGPNGGQLINNGKTEMF